LLLGQQLFHEIAIGDVCQLTILGGQKKARQVALSRSMRFPYGNGLSEDHAAKRFSSSALAVVSSDGRKCLSLRTAVIHGRVP
jgi:hypothetical protein